MQIDEKTKRLKAIKKRYVLMPTRCDCCGKEYIREKMWVVNRYCWNLHGELEHSEKWYYCNECMHSKEDVLHRIDTDDCLLGIYGVDEYYLPQKGNPRIVKPLEITEPPLEKN